jgi:uncharacterized protein YecE (DUF72 family)
MTEYRVGCSGWSYNHWRESFYPKGLPQSRWLEHYAGRFDTVELNATFYRLPTENAVRAWRERAPPGFRYAVKVSRFITHFRRLRDCEAPCQRYLDRIRLLGDRLGPLLHQLPPDFERDLPLLDAFIAFLPNELTHVFEFRNPSWWTDEVFDFLRARNATFCVYHMGNTETPVVATSGTFYMRFHGPEPAYAGGYSDDHLRDWAARIKSMKGVSEAWLYFNNDVAGHAPRDAIRLRELLKG